jgi:hypothetical protein
MKSGRNKIFGWWEGNRWLVGIKYILGGNEILAWQE